MLKGCKNEWISATITGQAEEHENAYIQWECDIENCQDCHQWWAEINGASDKDRVMAVLVWVT